MLNQLFFPVKLLVSAGPRLAALLALVCFLLIPQVASAYPWMIRHEYTGCAQCHADPSGGGLLTGYGRAIGETTLRTAYGKPVEDPKLGAFLGGLAPLPDTLLLGGDVRYLYYRMKPQGAPAIHDNFFMQADFQGQLTVDRFRVNGSIGYAQKGAVGAAISAPQAPRDPKAVSRVYWLGYALGEDQQFLLRAGRMNIPFGLRSIEHTMMVRCFRECGAVIGGTGSRTDTNDAQQHGIAFSYSGEKIRFEAMAMLGNYQTYPDKFRDRGYAGYIEYAFLPRLAVGVSSLLTYAQEDPASLTALVRQAHGGFVRWSPWRPLVLQSEIDFLADSQPRSAVMAPVNAVGAAGFLQADLEPVQGLHVLATGEFYDKPSDAVRGVAPPPVGPIFAGWGSLAWFFAPHADIRLDAVGTSAEVAHQRATVSTLMAQLHVYL